MDTRIRLDTVLVAKKLCSSRTEAQELIKRGVVFIDGISCSKSAQKVSKDAVITVTAKRPFVSRGGEKLQGCFEDVYGSYKGAQEMLADTVVLDVGSSTGGFTDCLLQLGVKSIDCVDVGTQQLHDTIRGDVRVSLFENQDIRTFKTIKKYDTVVVDVSFISLKDIASALVAFGTQGRTKYFILIKPQFEVGRGSTKKGIVKDTVLITETLNIIKHVFVSQGLQDVVVFPSHLLGGDGNQEYFLYGTL